MVIIHKERVAVPVPEMEPGTVFFDGGGHLMMVSDDRESEMMVACVDLGTGSIRYYYNNELGIPSAITKMEVE